MDRNNLIDAVRAGDAAAVRRLLATDAGHGELALMLTLASRDLKRVYALARSIAASPAYPTDRADRLMVKALLDEKKIDGQLEPLVTAVLQEIRYERRRRTPIPPLRGRTNRSSSRHDSPAVLRQGRADRFTGIPVESIGDPRSWVVGGNDASVDAGEIHDLEDLMLSMFVNEGGEFKEVTRGNYSATIDRAAAELGRIDIGSMTALDILNGYYRRVKESPDLSYLQCVLRATMMLYTDDRFFRILNQRWRDARSREMLGFSTLMSMAFRHAKYFIQGEVYRGVDLSDAHHYEQGLIFRWPFFVSASMSADVASAFGETLVTIEVPASGDVREIDRWSLCPDEREVLFAAYEVFEVIESGPREIRLRIFEEDPFFGTGYEIMETREVRRILE